MSDGITMAAGIFRDLPVGRRTCPEATSAGAQGLAGWAQAQLREMLKHLSSVLHTSCGALTTPEFRESLGQQNPQC